MRNMNESQQLSANSGEPDTKACTLDDSIYVKLQKEQRCSDRKWIRACQEPEGQGRALTAVNQRTFPGGGNILYGDCGGDYTAVNPCPEFWFVPLNVVNLLYINIPQYSLQKKKKKTNAPERNHT